MSAPVGVGIIGAGMISDVYLTNLTRFPDVRVLAVGDIDPERAKSRATQHGVPGWGTADDVIAHPGVELVVNLTIPAVHAEVSCAAVAAGKHVWSEKPIAESLESSARLLAEADTAGLLVGVAPDTVLGPGLQTAFRAIKRGDIGTPLSAQTTIQYPGPNLFHPSPEFLFAAGMGPLFDIGPYYFTTLAYVFGSFGRVAAVGSRGHDTRTVESGARAGTVFDVTATTHVSAVMTFAGGGVAQSLLSFDSPVSRQGVVEVIGTEGTISLPDPNLFNGPVRIARPATFAQLAEPTRWEQVPVTGPVYDRGAGVVDMARCIRTGGTPVASGALAHHVLDAMLSCDASIRSGQMVDVTTSVVAPPLLPEEWDPYESTLEQPAA